jgi:hypothetical protein
MQFWIAALILLLVCPQLLPEALFAGCHCHTA